MSPSLEFESVYFAYGRHRPVLQSFSHEFKPGVATWLRGANGSGKTTLLRLAAGLLRPRMGAVTASERPCYVASTTAFHEQLTLSEEIAYLRALSPSLAGALDTQLAAWRVSELDPAMEMDELSTGWRQRLALSLACAADRGIVLLDEPFANLDDDGTRLLQSWMSTTTRRGGAVVVAHHGERERLGDTDFDVVEL